MTVLRTRYQKHVISVLGRVLLLSRSRKDDHRSGGFDGFFPPGKRNNREMLTMSHGLSNYFGAIAAWMCLAPLAFARERITLAHASIPTHYIADLSLLLIWITGGIFLVVSGLLAFARFRFRARKSDPLSRPAQVYRSAAIQLAWTAIPVLVLVLFLL
jgi:uncharacterized membrane protein YidH (DUF202 family)